MRGTEVVLFALIALILITMLLLLILVEREEVKNMSIDQIKALERAGFSTAAAEARRTSVGGDKPAIVVAPKAKYRQGGTTYKRS